MYQIKLFGYKLEEIALLNKDKVDFENKADYNACYKEICEVMARHTSPRQASLPERNLPEEPKVSEGKPSGRSETVSERSEEGV